MMKMPYKQQRNYITLLLYGGIVTVSLVLTTVSSFCFYMTALKASENLHNKMTYAVIKAPVLFFDTNPVGRVLNRFSRDIGNMDDQLPTISLFAVQLCLYFVSAVILSAATNVWLFIVCTPLTAVFLYLAKYYLKSSREIRRLEAVTCSPVYSLITDTMAGLEVIRSSKMEDTFLKKFYKLVSPFSQYIFNSSLRCLVIFCKEGRVASKPNPYPSLLLFVCHLLSHRLVHF